MLKFAAVNFVVAMLPGNVFAPLNILLGFVCLNVAGYNALNTYTRLN